MHCTEIRILEISLASLGRSKEVQVPDYTVAKKLGELVSEVCRLVLNRGLRCQLRADCTLAFLFSDTFSFLTRLERGEK